jgi:lysine-specific histone demethylase 1
MAILRETYGASVPEPEQAIITRWGSDPYALGSYSQLGGAKSLDDVHMIAQPVEQRLYFAGEHTSEYCGTTHGAYLSGLRAAAEVQAL